MPMANTEHRNYLLGLALLIFAPLNLWAKDPAPTTTFEPGTRHTCVPQGQGWNCSPSTQTTPSTLSAPAPSPEISKETKVEPSNTATTHAAELPAYLTHAATQPLAGGEPAISSSNLESSTTNTNARPSSDKSRADRADNIGPQTHTCTENDYVDFSKLSTDRYTVELAHADHRAELITLIDQLNLNSADIYCLRFAGMQGAYWLLAWGEYESIPAARTALASLSHKATLNAGWPRRIGPLQTELKHPIRTN